MTVHCTSHCATCGSHFHATSAFDRHRRFEEGFKDDWDYRNCIEPADDPRFEALTDAGLCDIYPSRVKRGVTVWTNAGSREKAARIRS